MTTEKAIDLLDNLLGVIEDNHGNDYDEVLKIVIKLLNKIEQNQIDKIMTDSDRELITIVRCKNCRHYPGGRIAEEYGFECPIAHKRMFKDHFCECGETKAEYCKRNGRTSYESEEN